MNSSQHSCHIPQSLSAAYVAIFLLSPLAVTAQTWIGDALDSPGYEWNSYGFSTGEESSWSVSDSLSESHDGVDGVSMVVFATSRGYFDPWTGQWVPGPGGSANAYVESNVTVSVPSVCCFWYRRPPGGPGPGWQSPGMVSFSAGSNGLSLYNDDGGWTRAIMDIQSGVQSVRFDLTVYAYYTPDWPIYGSECLMVDQFTIEPMPGLSISDASVIEGNEGSSSLVFTVSLEHAVPFDVSADVGVSGGNSDYLDPPNSVRVPMGATQAQLIIPVVGDTLYEGDEQIQVQLTNPQHAFLTDSVAVGTIIDDDSPPTRLGIWIVGDAVQLSWNTVVGSTYTLQTSTDLISPDGWSDLQPHVNMPGSGETSSTTLAIDSARRFFRIKTNR